MLYVFMGPSCTGKSTAAEIVRKRIGAKIYSGKDYLRLAKAEGDAWRIFYEKMEESSKKESGESLIFVCTEKELFDRISVKEKSSLCALRQHRKISKEDLQSVCTEICRSLLR